MSQATFRIRGSLRGRLLSPIQFGRLYREAQLLEPNDVAALKGQGEALVAKGAVVRAKDNLVKIRTLCKGVCPEATQLAAVIAKGPPIATAQVDKTPVAAKD